MKTKAFLSLFSLETTSSSRQLSSSLCAKESFHWDRHFLNWAVEKKKKREVNPISQLSSLLRELPRSHSPWRVTDSYFPLLFQMTLKQRRNFHWVHFAISQNHLGYWCPGLGDRRKLVVKYSSTSKGRTVK